MSGTLKFIIIFSFFTGGAIGFLLMCRKKTFISKTHYSEKWSGTKKKTINWIVRAFLGSISVMLFVFITIPMSIDIPCLISGDYKTCKGVVT